MKKVSWSRRRSNVGSSQQTEKFMTYWQRNFDWFRSMRTPSEIWTTIKWAWQRVYRGWDNRVSWDFQYWMAVYAHEALDHYAKNLQGFPSNLQNAFPTDDKALKAWADMIGDAVYYLKYAHSDGISQWCEDNNIPHATYIKEYMRFKSICQIDKRANNGRKIFLRYYMHFWD